MRALQLTIFIFFCYTTSGQSLLDKNYSTDVCTCMDSLKLNNELNESNFLNCFQSAMFLNMELILKECELIYGDTTEESGYKLGKALTERITIALVSVCKTYFTLIDSLRYKEYKNIKTDSLQLELNNLNTFDASKLNKDVYSKRAMLLFHIKKYDEALLDIEKILIDQPNDLMSLYLKAWILEIKGHFTESISLYDKVAKLSKNNSFYIFSEIAKRKKNGL